VSVVEGVYSKLEEAQAKMDGGFEKEYFPDVKRADINEKIIKNTLIWKDSLK